MPETPHQKVILDIEDERVRQDLTWGGPEHDDKHSVTDWGHYIDHQLDYIFYDDPKKDYRQRFIKIAALAIAAVESMDRKRTQGASATNAPAR